MSKLYANLRRISVVFGVGSSLVSGFRRVLMLGGVVQGCCVLRSLWNGLHGGVVEGRPILALRSLFVPQVPCPLSLYGESFEASELCSRSSEFRVRGPWFKLLGLLVIPGSSSLWFCSFMAYSKAKFFPFFLLCCMFWWKRGRN